MYGSNDISHAFMAMWDGDGRPTVDHRLRVASPEEILGGTRHRQIE
jgi:hypothetical protein